MYTQTKNNKLLNLSCDIQLPTPAPVGCNYCILQREKTYKWLLQVATKINMNITMIGIANKSLH